MSWRLLSVSALLSVAAAAQEVLFEDTFSRADHASPGPGWAEYVARGQAPKLAETAWRVRDGALTFVATGSGTYVEDFVATVQAFPVEGTRVEFDLRAVTGTREGYVGPAVLWVDEPLRKRAAYNLDGSGPGYIGAGLYYRWENQGTGGALLFGGAHAPAWRDANLKVPGVNQDRFARHALTVKDGGVTWEIDGEPFARAPLLQPLPPGARRRLLIATRLYDRGLSQSVEVKNLRITRAGEPPAAKPARADETFVDADAPSPRARARLALAFAGPTLVIEAADTALDLARDVARWRIAIKGHSPGTFPAAVSFNLDPARGWLSTPSCSATLTRVERPRGPVEGRFDCVLRSFDGEHRGEPLRSVGTFRAELQP